jgi:hypothetical protein
MNIFPIPNPYSLSLNQGLATSDSPSFVRGTFTQADGTSPFVITSTTLNANLNADLLDGQHASAFQASGNYQPLATNLTSLAGLTFVSTSFVKMTAAGTFGLDTNTYLTSFTESDPVAMAYLNQSVKTDSTPTLRGLSVYGGDDFDYKMVQGYAAADAGFTASIIADAKGTFARGYVYCFQDSDGFGDGIIRAGGLGSMATGKCDTSNTGLETHALLSAEGDASFAGGAVSATDGTATVKVTGAVSFIWGFAGTGETLLLSGDRSFLFGSGNWTNSTNDSFQIGWGQKDFECNAGYVDSRLGYKSGGTAPVADGTYNTGRVTPVTGTIGQITVKGGIITAFTQAT